MKLYGFPVAPNPTKVRLYLAEKRAGGAALDVEEVSVDMRVDEQRPPRPQSVRQAAGPRDPAWGVPARVAHDHRASRRARADYFRAQLARPLDHLESRLADGREFLAGAQVIVADCTLAAGLQFGRFNELEFLDDHSRLSAWDDRYRAREEIQGILLA